MDKGPSKVAPESTAEESSLEDSLRQARLQVNQYGFDYSGSNDESESQVKTNNETHFKRGEAETIRKVLTEVEVIALKRTSEGFNQINFTLGVLDCFLTSFMIGACPQHLWLLYLIQSLLMIPIKFRNMWRAKPLNQALYYLDFCWCMNFLAIVFLAVLVLYEVTGFDVEQDIRKVFFKAALGVACGVLLSANIALPFVACVFHDVNTMTGLFIHLMPPMVMYTFWWHTDEITIRWPTIFNFSYVDEINYFGGTTSVAGCSTLLYVMWFIFYTSFMLLLGVNLPKKFEKNGQEANPKWDTVFHSTMRDGLCISIGKYLRGRKKADSLKQMEENDFDTIDFFIYMVLHMIAALGSIYTIGYGCFSNVYFHRFMLGISVVLAVVRGANRYTYYSTEMYTRALRKSFGHILVDDDGKAEYTRMN